MKWIETNTMEQKDQIQLLTWFIIELKKTLKQH